MSFLSISSILSLLVACSPPAKTTSEIGSTNETDESAPSLEIQSATSLHFFPENSQGKLKSIQLAWHGENFFPETPHTEVIQKIDWTITPNVAEKLYIQSADRLYLKPSQDIAPNTTVSIAVNSITLENGTIVTPTKPDMWKKQFVTPEFRVAYSAIKALHLDKNTASLNIKTSHIIPLELLKKNLRITLDDSTISKYTVTSNDNSNFTIDISSTTSMLNKTLRVDVDPMNYPESTVQSPAFTWSQSLQDSNPITLYGPFVQETSSGFSVEYVCDDSAVSSRHWYWNSSLDFDKKISERCAIDTTQLENSIQISPSVQNLRVYPKERGFVLIADFTHADYTITIPSGILSQDNGMLQIPSMETVVIPLRKPNIQFYSQGRYIPSAGWNAVHYQTRNVDEVIITIREVSKSNLHNWMAKNQQNVDASEGDIVYKETLEIQNNPDANTRSTINLEEKIPHPKPGIYEITIQDASKRISAKSLLQVTDTQIITKRAETEKNGTYHIWTLNSRTNETIGNTAISLISPAGNTMANCSTDANGHCVIVLPKDELGNAVAAIYAERNLDAGNKELTYLPFRDVQIDLGLYDTTGSSGATSTYRISTHSDRGAYRPGDTAHIFTIIRNKDNIAPQVGLPVQIKIRDGRGQIIQETTSTTNIAGVVEHTLAIAENANTGNWSVETVIQNAKKKENSSIQKYNFKVENLQPERMSITTKFQSSNVLGGQELAGEISARYLFGAPAKKAEFTARCEVEPTIFVPKTNYNYTYGGANAFTSFVLGTVHGVLDDNGAANFVCPSSDRTKGLPGTAKVTATIDVMEGGSGRSTQKTTTTTVHPHEQYIGLQIGTTRIDTNKNYPISGIVVDWEGKRQTSATNIELQFGQIDTSYNWYYDEEEDEYKVNHRKFTIPLQTDSVSVKNGYFQHNIQGADADGYNITASTANTSTSIELKGSYNYWYEDDYESSSSSFVRPDALTITAPSVANVEDTISVSTDIPYTGKILWTVESDGIIKEEWMDAKENLATWSFSPSKILAKQNNKTPNNIYVSALLIKDAHVDSPSAYMPARAFGVQSIAIRSDVYNHTINITTPKETQANKVMNVSIDLGSSADENAVAMIAVVDEGLLSLTNFSSPDPSNNLLPKMPLEIDTFETIGWSTSSPSLGEASAGGSEGGGKRKAQVVKPVALWSGIKEIPASGKLDVSFDIPQYSGELRVMVVTSSPKKFGSAQSNVFVREPITLQASLPRFITQGDQIQVPVFITNTTDTVKDADITLTATDMSDTRKNSNFIKFLGANKTTEKLQPNEQKVVVFQVEALAETGFAEFTVMAKSGDLVSKEVVEVPFASRKPTEREFVKLHLSEITNQNTQGTIDITPYLGAWLTEDTTIWASTNMYAESLVRMRDLIHYPYGCVEQTSTSLRPLITAKDTLENIDPQYAVSIDDKVQAGIERLASMKTDDGGIGYWPGSESAHPWGTAYASHVLLDARDAGYTVLPSLLDGTINYLETLVQSNTDYDYYGYGTTAHPYAHYILARVGKGKPQAIKALLANETHNFESEYMLKTALFLSGDRQFEKELQNLEGISALPNDYDYWTFRSKLRSQGLILALHQEMFGVSTPKGDALANEIHNTLVASNNRNLSTQSLSWSTFALSKRILSNTDWKAPVVKQNNKTHATATSNKFGSSWYVWDTASNKNNISLQGQGSDAYIVISTSGIKKDGMYAYGDNGIRVSRKYQTLSGGEFNSQNHSLGEEVVVVVTIENLHQTDIHELALVDRIPAGWEINNPNLQDTPDVEALYTEERWEYDYLSVKDNSMEIFGDINNNETLQIIYTIRATTVGNFYVPPISIEAMYDDSIWSRAQGFSLSVLGSWDGSLL